MADIGHFQLMYSKELSSLRTCFDFSEFAKARIKERISPKACSLEKTAAIAKFSAESLRWLLEDAHEHYEIICRRAISESVSPFRASNWSLYPHYWVYQVTKAIVLLDQFPLDEKVWNLDTDTANTLAPNRKYNSAFKQYWPKTPGTTAFYSANMSAAEAISEALLIFMEKSHLMRFPDLPNDIAFPNGYDLSDRDKIIKEFNKTGDVLPLVLDFQNLSCYWAVEYMSPDKWTSGEIEKECSKAICLVDDELEQALLKLQVNDDSKVFKNDSLLKAELQNKDNSDGAVAMTEKTEQVFQLVEKLRTLHAFSYRIIATVPFSITLLDGKQATPAPITTSDDITSENVKFLTNWEDVFCSYSHAFEQFLICTESALSLASNMQYERNRELLVSLTRIKRGAMQILRSITHNRENKSVLVNGQDEIDVARKNLESLFNCNCSDCRAVDFFSDLEDLNFFADEFEAAAMIQKESKQRERGRIEIESAKKPLENGTAPTTLKRMAELWGGDMTPKKLKGLIDNERIKAVALNRQTYVFDATFLPESVVKALEK